mmetsp:Transcript_52001/g.137361  ORF Transcript_52001/g.137361 Transcript_52001/m.137361 type:complete len:577 (-) Transcript_52001:45-1775(-)
MARRLCVVVFLAAAASSEDAVGSHDSELLDRFAELERMVQSQQRMIESQAGLIETQQGRILNLESHTASSGASADVVNRRLQTGVAKSIYEPSGSGGYSELESTQGAMTHVWLLLCGALVVSMHAGFAMVKVGSCRAVSAQSILLASLLDVCLATLGWWVSGWAIAFSGPMSLEADGLMYKKLRVAGYEQFAGHQFLGARSSSPGRTSTTRSDGQVEPTFDMVRWFFQWACCTVATTIVSGGVCERVLAPGHAIYVFLMAACIYPVIVACTKGMGLLATEVNSIGFTDFAGSGIIHLTGGVGSLIGSIAVGARKGRFDRPKEFAPHNMPLVVLGTFLLWFGWYGLNCGSTMAMNTIENGFMAAQVAMNTTLGAATGGLVAFLMRSVGFRKYDVAGFCNGILAGLVAVSGSCGNVECGFACIIGGVGAFLYVGTSWLMRRIQVDDPVDAFAVHGAAGAWGVVAAAVFDWGAVGSSFNKFHGHNGFRCAFTPGTNECMTGLETDGIVANFVEIGVVFVWVGVASVVILLPLRFCGLLRASEDKQELGQDEFLHRPVKAYVIEPFLSSKPLFRSTLQAI